MSISHHDVEHIARLARIAITPDEITQIQRELTGILGFVEKLNELDTATIEPMTGGTMLINRMREDAVCDAALCKKNDALLHASPETSDHYVKVKAIFNS